MAIILTSFPIHASNSDDEIINNLEFFQDLELIKNDNPYLGLSLPSIEQNETAAEKKTEKKK